MVTFLRASYWIHNPSPLVFICGGIEESTVRMQFINYCRDKGVGFIPLIPEVAISEAIKLDSWRFDLGKFEELIAKLSSAIIIFPEAAGSYTETGYFAKNESITEKTLLVLDNKYRDKESFISMGPAQKYEKSRYAPLMYIDYQEPYFDNIIKRISEKQPKKTKSKAVFELNTSMSIDEFKTFCLIEKIIDLLRVASIEDISFICKSIFGSVNKSLIGSLISIMKGVDLIKEKEEYGHYYEPNIAPRILMAPLQAEEHKETKLRTEIYYCAMKDKAFAAEMLGNASNAA